MAGRRRALHRDQHHCAWTESPALPTVQRLRDAGLTAEAERLEVAVQRSKLWGSGDSTDETVALSLFGCCEAGRLAQVCGLA